MSRRQVYLAAVLFALAHTQSLRIYSNQNQYLLHAAARLGYGDLANDWLAQTVDPTPVFTALIMIPLNVLGLLPLHIAFFALLMVYFVALWHMVRLVGWLPKTWAGQWAWAALLTASHAGILRWASDRTLGVDYPWFLQSGLAGQYLLGPGLQPSVFGVFLLVGLALIAAGRPVWAAVVIASVNWLHATYLLPAALLIGGIFIHLRQIKESDKSGQVFAAGLLIATPVVIYFSQVFAPTSDRTFAEAQRILAQVRIPHHTQASRWFDGLAAVQLVWMGAGVALLHGSKLFGPVAWACAGAVAASALVIVTNHSGASLLFPWRLSAVIVPLSTALLLAALARAGERWERACTVLASVILFVCVSGAGAVYAFGLGYQEPAAEDAVLEFVRQHHKPGYVYLIPARFPKPNPPAGVFSNTFAPPPRPDATVYFELARFRLATGAQLFVDFKSIPYRDTEVMEWHRRMEACVNWFNQPIWDGLTWEAVVGQDITHIIAPTALRLSGRGLRPLEVLGAYEVFAVTQQHERQPRPLAPPPEFPRPARPQKP